MPSTTAPTRGERFPSDLRPTKKLPPGQQSIFKTIPSRISARWAGPSQEQEGRRLPASPSAPSPSKFPLVLLCPYGQGFDFQRHTQTYSQLSGKWTALISGAGFLGWWMGWAATLQDSARGNCSMAGQNFGTGQTFKGQAFTCHFFFPTDFWVASLQHKNPNQQ